MTTPVPLRAGYHDVPLDPDVVAEMIEIARSPETADELLAILDRDPRYREGGADAAGP